MDDKKRRRLRIAGFLVGGLALLIFALAAFFALRPAGTPTNGSYEALMESYYAAVLNGDGEALARCMAPDAYWNYYMEAYGKTWDDVVATYTDACANSLSAWESSYGAPVTLSYTIDGASAPDQTDVDEWNENIELEELQITQAATLQVTLTITGADSSGTQTTSPTVVQMEGQWYILEEDSADEDSSG